MLRKKLKLGAQEEEEKSVFWQKIWKLEKDLYTELLNIDFKKSDKNIAAIYNSLDYAEEVHINYLKKYLKKPVKVLFLGMNPGIFGMSQTGVPFGHVPTVKNWMKLSGHVGKPKLEIESKKVEGFNCTREEMSGKRFWGLIQEISVEPENFFQNCFVHNICPLAFLASSGRNITPTEIKGEAKSQLNTICLKFLADAIVLFDPLVIVNIGTYCNDRIKELKKKNLIADTIECKLIPHPSPRSLNNHDWVEKARKWFEDNDVIKYFNGSEI